MLYSKEDIISKKFKNVEINVLPQRGAIITSMKIKGKELLYQEMLDETLWNTDTSIRGGIPFMFPQAGALTSKQMQELGYAMPQHGIARNNIWELYDEGPNSISFVLDSKDQQTQNKVPIDFRIIVTYTLMENGVKLLYEISNNSRTTFAISPGIHPYFAIPEEDKDDIEFDENYADQIVSEKEVWQNDGTTFVSLRSDRFNFEVPGVGKLQLRFDENTRNIWIWSLPVKSFVCVEPVAGNPGNIITKPINIPSFSKHTIVYEIVLLA